MVQQRPFAVLRDLFRIVYLMVNSCPSIGVVMCVSHKVTVKGITSTTIIHFGLQGIRLLVMGSEQPLSWTRVCGVPSTSIPVITIIVSGLFVM